MTYRSPAGRAAIEHQYARWLETIPGPIAARRIPTRFGDAHVLRIGRLLTEDGRGAQHRAPAVIALAGTNFPALAWTPLSPLTKRGLRLFAVDLIGQPGRSDGDRLPPSSPDLVRWLSDVMDGLELASTHLVGHSLGGHLALHFAAVRAARVDRVALICPSGLMRLRVPAPVLARTVAWLARPNRRTSSALLRRMSEPGQDVEDLVPWMSVVGGHVWTSLAPRPLPARVLATVSQPVLVIAGERDPFLPGRRLAEATRRRLPHARTVVVEGAGHLLPHDRPAEMLRLLTAFVDG